MFAVLYSKLGFGNTFGNFSQLLGTFLANETFIVIKYNHGIQCEFKPWTSNSEFNKNNIQQLEQNLFWFYMVLIL